MTDSEKLKNKIREKGLKIAFISEKLDLSRTAFYNKINNISEFTVKEMEILCKILEIKEENERKSIFFTQ
ncbi:hypothetical protein ACQRC6_06465 [Peptoniphilus sp. SGI.035]|uniref:hypothetical protein n=1 Tax=Peptoniphilus sp. SGI.035 TaxID=3420564 RepID=UPI003CFC288B